jgi:hypothetical protein
VPAFERRTLTLAPGTAHAAGDAGWPDAIVLVARGAVELECAGGSSRRFEAGDLIWLRGLALRALRNHGPGDAVLVAVARRRPPRGSTP